MFHQGCILPWLSKVIITLSDTCQRQRSVLKCGGAVLPLSHVHTPTQIFQNALCIVRWRKQTSLQPSQCIVCQLSICGNASVGSCSGSPAPWCFLGSSWVVWGPKMCSLKSPMSLVLSNTSVKALPVQIFVWGWGRGGFGSPCPPAPPPMHGYVLLP